ncbi:MAG: hypothetical protein JST75_18220 [Bacteroidetes bacterium]|nr:hypothetical protein [Bacteroidota bacterium]
MLFEQPPKNLGDGIRVSAAQIELLKNCYRENNWKLNSQRLGDEETLYAIIPTEDLITFIEKSGIKGATRFHIYFGAFPTPFPDFALLAGRITFCFVGVNENDRVYYGEDQPEFGIAGFNAKDQVEIFIENYKADRHAHNSIAIGKLDSIGAGCRLDTLKNFLSEKQNAGFVRVYIGAYPDNYKPEPKLSMVQTIVLVRVEEGANRTANDILNGENPGLNLSPILVKKEK